MICPHSNKACVGNYLCELCKVPNAFGYFMTLDKRGLMRWEQRFITEPHREAYIRGLEAKIAELQTQIDEVREIPAKGVKNE